jgi:hypothetical protein
MTHHWLQSSLDATAAEMRGTGMLRAKKRDGRPLLTRVYDDLERVT